MSLIDYIDGIGPFHLLGVVGSIIYILSFACVQIGKMDGNGIYYSICNVLAAFLVVLSLSVEFNLASALIQYSWIVIGLVGLSLRFFGNQLPQRTKFKLKNGARNDCS